MASESFGRLVRAVLNASESDAWGTAVMEWQVTDLEEDPAGNGECVCGQLDLVQLFTIRNTHNGSELHPIGSTCVKKFGRADLNRELTLFSDLLLLRHAVDRGKRIVLTSDYFSRAMIEHFRDEGVLLPINGTRTADTSSRWTCSTSAIRTPSLNPRRGRSWPS